MKRFTVWFSLLVFMSVSVCGVAVGQQSAEEGDASDAKSFVDAAKQYTITTAREPDKPFELVPEPLLTWSNPERRTPSGAVFLYTQHGQPRAALCVYPSLDTLDHEFQSLATEPLQAKRDGVLVWSPRSAGLEMKPIEGAPPPSATPYLRLREMRNLSRSFEAAIVSPEFSPKPLRLLPTPIYRYPGAMLPKGIIDGALFSFVQSTDPEVLLLLEAREDAAGARQWHFGLARMSMVRLSVRRDGKEIWRTEWAVQSPTTPYYTISGN